MPTLCDVCIEYVAEECSCATVECACYDAEDATGVVWMRDERGKPVQVPVCDRHFRAAARVRIKHQIPLRLPLHLPEEPRADEAIAYPADIH